MTGHYKDGELYAYQKRLLAMDYNVFGGAYLVFGLGNTGGGINHDPKNWEKYQPENYNGWEWRRAIKDYLLKETNIRKDFVIVKAVGYWRDLHPLIYEVYLKKGASS